MTLHSYFPGPIVKDNPSVKSVNPHNGLHFTLVFPTKGEWMNELYLGYQFVTQVASFVSVIKDVDLDREALNYPDHMIVFFRELPPWLPMKTAAKIGLVYMGQPIHNKKNLSGYDPKEISYFHEFSRYSLRADLVLHSTNEHSFLDGIARRIARFPSFNYIPSVYGGYPTSILRGYPHDYRMVGYGKLNERRATLCGWLQQFFGRKFIWVEELDLSGRIKLFSNTLTVFYGKESEDGCRLPSPVIPQFMAGPATVVTDYEDYWPLSNDSLALIYLARWMDASHRKDEFLSILSRYEIHKESNLILAEGYAKRYHRDVTRNSQSIAPFGGLSF